MTTEQVWLGAAGAVALVALTVALLAHRRARRAESLAASLTRRVALLEAPAKPTPAVPDTGTDTGTETAAAAYVITHLGDQDGQAGQDGGDGREATAPVARPIDGRLFTDIVARETVVRAAGWTHGLRRALSPETRNRIRFAVRQESRQAGRERRAEMKQALREFRARERAAVREDVA